MPNSVDGAGEALCFVADALVVDANRTGDGALGGQQDRLIGGDPVDEADAVGGDLVQQRLAALEDAGDALTDIWRHTGRIVEPTLQLRAAGVERAHCRLRVATGRRRQHRAVESGHVANDCGHHFGTVGRTLKIAGLNRVRVDAQPAEGTGQNQRHQDNRKHLPADWPISQRPSRGTFRCGGRMGILVFDQAVQQVLLRERGHCCPATVPAASPSFPNGASFIRLPADLPSCGLAFYAWQLIEYASRTPPFPQFLLNRQSSRAPSERT
jgi:hypothetical protein